jgi:hypothetical protein
MLDRLEELLDRGERLGFAKPTGDDEYLGWILIAKVKANVRLLELFSGDHDDVRVEEEKRRLKRPYMVLQIELKRTVHEAGDYETDADYRQKERLWFANLEEVAEQLRDWGYDLHEARGARELDAP